MTNQETPGRDGQQTLHKPYKILMIAPTSFFSDYGCSVRILEEARVLRRRGHELTVCTYRNGQDVPGLSIRRTASIPFREHYEVGSSLHKVAFDLLLFWTVLRTALRQRPDVIHAHMHEGALIGLLVGKLLRTCGERSRTVPLVFDFQGSLTGEMLDHRFLHRESLFYRPLRWLEERIDRRAPAILTSSHNARQLLLEQFGVDPARVTALADCVDAEAFHPVEEGEHAALAERRAALGIPPERRVVVYLGLLADYQGTDALLQAAAQVLQQRDDVHFLIMGFPAVETYRQMARDLGLAGHTTFTGKVPYAQARDHLAVGDLAVAPKLSATEGSGKILNYMAMGLPTVAFGTPVSREYLGDQGIYAEPGDPASLAQALLRGLSDPANGHRRNRLRQTALDEYSWDSAANTIQQAYAAVCLA
jgi:glycosyltransferase involved in cell wall biosynthesis